MATDVTQLLIKVNSNQVGTASNRVDRLGRSAGKTTRATDKLTMAFKRFAGPLAIAYGVAKLTKFIVKTGMAFETFEKQLYAVTGTSKLASAELDYLADVADKNAVKLSSSIKPYVRMKESMRRLGLEAETTRNIFEGVSNAAATFGLTAHEVNGVLVAFTQVASKGKVQAEELRNQIAERIPGALALAEKAAGVTNVELQKMLETGQLMAKDFLPAFGALMKQEFGTNLERKTDTLAASATRASNAFDLLGKEIFELSADTIGQFISLKGMLDVIAMAAGETANALKWIKEDRRDSAFVRIAEDISKVVSDMEKFNGAAAVMRKTKYDALIQQYTDLAEAADFDQLAGFMSKIQIAIYDTEVALERLNASRQNHTKTQKDEVRQLEAYVKALSFMEQGLPSLFEDKPRPAAIDIGSGTGQEEKQDLALERLKKYLNAEWEARDAAFIEEELQLDDKYARDLAKLDEAYAGKKDLDAEYADFKFKLDSKLTKDLENLKKREALSSQRTQLQAYSQIVGMAGDLSSELLALTEEGSSAQKALFLTTKALSIGQAILATELAAQQASADPTNPTMIGKIAAATLIRTLGYASVGVMIGTTAAGFAQGGIVPGGSFNSDNVTASVNSGEMILNFAQQKQLLDMANGDRRSSGQGVSVNVINNSGSEIEVQEDEGKNGQRMIEIIVSKVEKNMASKVQQGGNMFSKSFEGAYGLKRGNS